MTDQEAKNLFMDYLFDEMDDEQKQDFEKQLEENPELQKELKELQSTHQLLQAVPIETPPHKLVTMTPIPGQPSKAGDAKDRSPEGGSKIRKLFTRYHGLATVFAAAASLLIVLLGAAFVDLRVGQTEQGFYVNFGEPPVQQQTSQGLTEQEVYDLMEQIRQENSILLASMAEELREQQNEQLEEAISVLTNYYDQRRRQDLQLISEGLAQLEEDTYYRLRQTDETLGDLIYALSYPQTQSTQE